MNEPLLTPKELAGYLKIPVATVYYWHSIKKVLGFKIGKHLRFKRSEIDFHFGIACNSTQAACANPKGKVRSHARSLKNKERLVTDSSEREES